MRRSWLQQSHQKHVCWLILGTFESIFLMQRLLINFSTLVHEGSTCSTCAKDIERSQSTDEYEYDIVWWVCNACNPQKLRQLWGVQSIKSNRWELWECRSCSILQAICDDLCGMYHWMYLHRFSVAVTDVTAMCHLRPNHAWSRLRHVQARAGSNCWSTTQTWKSARTCPFAACD